MMVEHARNDVFKTGQVLLDFLVGDRITIGHFSFRRFQLSWLIEHVVGKCLL